MAAGDVAQLRDVWEATGFRLEREQAAEETVEAERRGLAAREAPRWTLPYTPTWTPDDVLGASDKPRVAILRWVPSSMTPSLPLPCTYFRHHLLWNVQHGQTVVLETGMTADKPRVAILKWVPSSVTSSLLSLSRPDILSSVVEGRDVQQSKGISINSHAFVQYYLCCCRLGQGCTVHPHCPAHSVELLMDLVSTVD